MVTKIIDLQVEDFLEKLNEAAAAMDYEAVNIFKTPKFLIGNGNQEVSISCCIDETYIVMLDIKSDVGKKHLKSLIVVGNCGNLAFEKTGSLDPDTFHLEVELGSTEDLQEAMTTSGNHKLDLQVTLTVKNKEVNTEWIIRR